MKIFCIIALFTACGALILHAQTNSDAVLQTSNTVTRIDSDSADFDLNGHRAIYRGNVRVDDPRMRLTCARLTVDLPQSGGQPTNIVAETNVVIDFTDERGQTNHITSDKAVYIFVVEGSVTNETVTFTGNPKIENTQSIITAEPIVWDRLNGQFHFTNPKMISRQNLNFVPATTNPPPLKISRTNFPPGTISNVDLNLF